MAYLILGVFESHVQLLHCVKDEPEGLNNIVEDDRLPLHLLRLAETLRVDELHLLEHGRFARFTGTCEGVDVSAPTATAEENRTTSATGARKPRRCYVPSNRSLTSFDMRFSSWRMTLSSSRERATPSSFSLLPKHMMAGRWESPWGGMVNIFRTRLQASRGNENGEKKTRCDLSEARASESLTGLSLSMSMRKPEASGRPTTGERPVVEGLMS